VRSLCLPRIPLDTPPSTRVASGTGALPLRDPSSRSGVPGRGTFLEPSAYLSACALEPQLGLIIPVGWEALVVFPGISGSRLEDAPLRTLVWELARLANRSIGSRVWELARGDLAGSVSVGIRVWEPARGDFPAGVPGEFRESLKGFRHREPAAGLAKGLPLGLGVNLGVRGVAG
jgi:hypothetical protein